LPQDYIISPRREQNGTDDTRLDWALLAVEVLGFLTGLGQATA